MISLLRRISSLDVKVWEKWSKEDMPWPLGGQPTENGIADLVIRNSSLLPMDAGFTKRQINKTTSDAGVKALHCIWFHDRRMG
jgi:hypothetical protein